MIEQMPRQRNRLGAHNIIRLLELLRQKCLLSYSRRVLVAREDFKGIADFGLDSMAGDSAARAYVSRTLCRNSSAS